MKLLLQFPEGLKNTALEYAEKYRKQGHEVYLSASPCYGACDLPLEEAIMLEVDKIIHFGHSKFVTKHIPIPIEYIETKVDIQLPKTLPKELEPYKKIAIATTVQHVHELDKIKLFLEKNGKIVLIGKGTKTAYPGQVLGCDSSALSFSADHADAVLFIGGGLFHPLAIKLNKPIFVYNPYLKKLENLSDKITQLKKKRKGILAKALTSKSFGILISTKIGQFNPQIAKEIKSKLESKGKSAEILIANNFDPYSLENFSLFDCYITTACPRISDDFELFKKPILDLELFNQLISLV